MKLKSIMGRMGDEVVWEMNNRPIGGCSSETFSDPNSMNIY
jgi:hypothetical protein